MNKCDYPGRTRPPVTKVTDAKEKPNAAKDARKKQLGRNGMAAN